MFASTAVFALTVYGQVSIAPIEVPSDINMAQAELGKKLFFDPRLSKSGFISCNSCHNLSMGGSDNLPTSIGHDWQQGPINSPTVLNASYNLAQFWDGRAKDLKEQAGGPIANPKEMAFSHAAAVKTLQTIPGYVAEFEAVFGDNRIDIDRLTSAIAEFEKTLVTPNSAFDKFLKGDKAALSAEQQAGYKLFTNSGCTACHNGPALGGTMYQKMGLIKPYKTDNPAQGRFDVTKNEADRMFFKVPTLRNVAMTYPYFHDGAVYDLGEAVKIMGELQLGRSFSAKEQAQLVAFLNSLTGEQPNFDLPILPPSAAHTPPPQPFKP
ncbi:MAG: cytochrome-c peroxidase [Cellvibrionaceae bacterium]|nr:cytochrome-c peroxidase [Cellvibrionaceae bacterium]